MFVSAIVVAFPFYILAQMTETVTKTTLFINQRSPHHNLKRNTSDIVTLHSNYDTEIIWEKYFKQDNL